MGTWHGSTTAEALYRLLDEVDPSYLLRSRTEMIDKLKASGLIVDAPFYVPDMGELFGLKRTWSYYLDQGMEGVRWVMCRETVDALVRKYDQVRSAPPQAVDFELSADGAAARAASASLGLAVVTAPRSGLYPSTQYTLFGVPVRIDPAARSPLFEIDSEWTKGAARGDVR